MIVELPSKPDDSLEPLKLGYFFFPNNNLAFRRKCFDELGGYDESLSASEDVDICFRLGDNADWVALRENAAVVHHHPRTNFYSFIRQMWWWGWELGGVYKKTSVRGFYFYLVSAPKKVSALEFDLSSKLPILLAVFLTDFHIVNFLLFTLFLTLFIAAKSIVVVVLVLLLYFIYRYYLVIGNIELPLNLKARVIGLHYIANIVFVTSAFLGGIRKGVFFIPASILPPSHSS